MPTRKKGSHLLLGLCSQNSTLVFPAKQVEVLCRDTSKLSIRRPQSSTRRQTLHHPSQSGEIDDRPPRALGAPADGFHGDSGHAQQHQLRVFSLPIDLSMGKQLRHTRHILGTPLQIIDSRLLSSLMATSRTVGVVSPVTQCTGTVPFHSGIESIG